MKKRSFQAFLAAIGAFALAATVVLSATGCENPADGGKTLPALTGTISISGQSGGTAVTGATLTAVYSGSETVTFQWYKDGKAISGAINAAYTPSEAGAYTVTVSAAGYTGKTSITITVTGASLVDLPGNVTISPSENVTTGTPLTASYSGSENVTYQWNKDGAVIAGASGNKHTPAEQGSYTVTASAAGYRSKTSAAVAVTGAALPDLPGNVTISPDTGVTVGTPLTADYSGDEAVAYLWNKDGELIPGVSGNKYTPAEAGSYTVTAGAAGYKSKTSAPVEVTGAPLPDLPGNVTISQPGGVTIGTPLTAYYSGSEAVSWQWNRDGAAIEGAASEAYTPTEPGAYTATASAEGYKSKTSSAVAVTFPALTGTAAITGSPIAGQPLTADVSGLNGTGTYYYQWKRGDTANAVNTDISGATAQSYTLVAADNGKYIAVTVTCSANSGSVTSPALGPVTTINIYTVTFNKNHSDTSGWTEANPQTMTVTTPAVTLVNLPQSPTRALDAFIGWNTREDGSGTAFTAAATVTASITVYAQWQQWPAGSIFVTSGADSGAGTLRRAIEDAPAGGTIVINSTVGTISLSSRLFIDKSLTIMGNGAVITRAASWTATSNTSQLLYVALGPVNISRIHFKDGRADNYGAAIRLESATLALESCIFSGNQTSGSSAYGGAVYAAYSGVVLQLRGCTFYNNKSGGYGGAVYHSSGTLTLAGNLFYGNTAAINGPAVSGSGTVTSQGYNVVDAALGTANNQSGWTAAAGDKAISSLPMSPVSFRLLSGSGAAGALTSLPDGYPSLDFYGSPIAAGGGAGAVQSIASGSGYYLGLTVNDPARGSASASPAPDAEGFVTGPVTLTAAASSSDYPFSHWLVNGVQESANPLTVPMTGHTTVQAVFGRIVTVTGTGDGATTPGTLRYALTNAQDWDVIRFSTAHTVALGSALPQITKSITIEGNGSTITRAASWTATDYNTQLLRIDYGTVNISRIHFKDGRATGSGAAIRNDGTLTLESCIFSGNQTSSSYSEGGAVYNQGTMNLRGCTFYNNKSGERGGAVYNSSNGTLTLAGNLFYGDTAAINGPAVSGSGTVTSQGYNVFDVGGWTAAAGDKTISSLPISPATFRLLSGREAAGALASLPDGYPSLDFYGDPITAGGAAGAVQATASGGYYLDLTVSNAARGSVSASPAPNADGLRSGTVTMTVSATAADCAFSHWLVNGARQDGTPLALTLTGHTTAQAVFTRFVTVNSAGDSAATAGTLRYALTNAQDEDIIRFSAAHTVALGSALPYITNNITIEGNGSTITRAASWTATSDTSQLLVVYYPTNVVNISRLHFKDGRATDRGGAIRNDGILTLESCIFSGNQTSSTDRSTYGGAIYNNGTLTLESCIFSGNQTSSTNVIRSAYGGAVCNSSNGTLTLRGCTFYNNKSGYGGAVYNFSNSTLTLAGNLFYGNTAADNGLVVDGLVTSQGYNVVDAAMGTADDQSGWTAAAGDKTISGLPMSPVTFRLLSGSGAAGALTSLPDGYPSADFYGDPIAAGGAAGAVQSTASGSGYYLGLTVNNPAWGSVNASPAPDADGFVTGPATLTASAASGYALSYWLVNGVLQNGNPFTVPMTGHTIVQAVFGRLVEVSGAGDTNTTGTLRYALTNAQDGDVIRFSAAYTIELTSALPGITKSITIEGNGSTITPAVSWIMTGATSELLNVSSITAAVVNISRIHFKDSRANNDNPAILNSGRRILTVLESCIFSGNSPSGSNSYGGAVRNNAGTLNLRGCTFYNNRNRYGGAVSNSGTLTLTGNLFYGNTAGLNSGPVVYNYLGRVTSSQGYNVVDVALGTGDSESGWTAAAGDTTFNLAGGLGISGDPFDTTTFVPVAGLRNVMPSTPVTGFPITDFNGATRTWPGAPGAVK